MQKYWFDHIHLNSPEPEKTAEFYEKKFGAERVNKIDSGNGRVLINLSLGGTTLLISTSRDNGQTGLVHFGIGTDNLEEAAGELKASGVEFTMEPREVRPGFKVSFFNDYESQSVELQEGTI